MVIFPGKVLENNKFYPWKIKHPDILLFFMFLYLELSKISFISMKKKANKKQFQSTHSEWSVNLW